MEHRPGEDGSKVLRRLQLFSQPGREVSLLQTGVMTSLGSSLGSSIGSTLPVLALLWFNAEVSCITVDGLRAKIKPLTSF